MSSNYFPPKVIIDTNVFISAIFWGGKPRKVIEAWAKDKLDLVISPAILAELQKQINTKAKILKTSSDYASQWLEVIEQKAIKVSPKEKIAVCRHPKDNVLLEACLAGEAEYLVTGDKDLLVLKNFKKTKILTTAKFIKMM